MSVFGKVQTWHSVGVILTPDIVRGKEMWGVKLNFQDAGWCETDSTEGELRLRYLVTRDELTAKVQVLLDDAKRLGFAMECAGEPAEVYIKGDGENENVTYPADWRQVVRDVAAAVGLGCCYKAEP